MFTGCFSSNSPASRPVAGDQPVGGILFSTTSTEDKSVVTPDQIDLTPFSELYMSLSFAKPMTDYLQELGPEVPVAELDTTGNFQFTFYVDGKKIYTNNLHPGASTTEEKRESTRLDKPLVTDPFSGWWSAYLWRRFMIRGGGQEALSAGKHELRIEVRPYLGQETVIVGELIASGDVTLNVVLPSIEGVDLSAIAVNRPLPYPGLAVAARLKQVSLLQELRASIEAKIYKDVNSIVVLKNGAILVEEYYNGTDRQSLHDVRSVGKTFASTALGMAIADGHLESEQQKLSTFYELRDYANYNPRKESITLKDLLTMSSAFVGNDDDYSSPGNEENMYPTEDWVRFTLNLPLKPATDRDWRYFTAGVVLLGDVLHQKVPDGLEEYTARKLFTPLGITSQVWQYTPQGVASTAGGIRMTSLDFAKYGLLYAQRGRWGGKQLVPTDWVDRSFTHHASIPDRTGEYYGYLFWNKTYTVGDQSFEAYYCSGNGGNKIFIFPAHDLVVVVTATAYGAPYAHPQVDEIMKRYVLPTVLSEG